MSRLLKTLQNLPFVRREEGRMGADQSSPGHLRSQRDENLPYTSYSISKPIDGDSGGRASPRLQTRSKTLSKEVTGKDTQSGASTSNTKHDIVVVTEGNNQPSVDPDVTRLDGVPVFFPLLRASANIQDIPDGRIEPLEKVDNRCAFQLCNRYQEHLRQCAEAVAFDQNALCVRIKEVDFSITTIYNNLTDRQKKFAKYAEQIQKINEMSNVLNKIKMNVDQTIPILERLNSVLPPEDQLEPFSMKPSSR